MYNVDNVPAIAAIILEFDQTLINSSLATPLMGQDRWDEVDELIPRLTIYMGVDHLLSRLAKNDIKIGVVTHTPRTYVDKIVAHTGWGFDAIVCANDSEYHKPHPKSLGMALALLGVKAEETIALGCSEDYSTAAIRAGLAPVTAGWSAYCKSGSYVEFYRTVGELELEIFAGTLRWKWAREQFLYNQAYLQGEPTDGIQPLGEMQGALERYRQSAEDGSTHAQFNLALVHELGWGLEVDHEEAVKWFSKAAEQGHAAAQHNLGGMYGQGRGIKKSDASAFKWLRKSAEQGHPETQRYLGVMYEKGIGIPKDAVEAIKWYRKAAEQGHARAQFQLAMIYGGGCGVRRDAAKVRKWIRRSAKQGYDHAQYILGRAYARGRGITQNDNVAIKWYRKAAEQGYDKAQFELGVMYADGRGVKQNDKKAIEWCRKAAEQGHSEAVEKLAQLS